MISRVKKLLLVFGWSERSSHRSDKEMRGLQLFHSGIISVRLPLRRNMSELPLPRSGYVVRHFRSTRNSADSGAIAPGGAAATRRRQRCASDCVLMKRRSPTLMVTYPALLLIRCSRRVAKIGRCLPPSLFLWRYYATKTSGKEEVTVRRRRRDGQEVSHGLTD